MKPKCLDLFCKAGGATRGYQLAGFHVTGVDIEPQRHYCGDAFVLGDALEYLKAHWQEYDMIHASPPCEGYSKETPLAHKSKHPRMIPLVSAMLKETGKPYVIENVPDARFDLENPVMLCGSMFGLPLFRHRYFECNPALWFTDATCNHSFDPVLITGTPRRKRPDGTIDRREYTVAECRAAAQIDWMTRSELDKAIPPAYTEWIASKFISGGVIKL